MPHPDQLFVDPRDVLTDETMVEEMYYSTFARHPYYVLDQSDGVDLYGDASAEPVYSVKVDMPMLVRLDPEEQLLSKYGIDKKRAAIIWFSRKICHDLGVMPKIGDRIDFAYRTAAGSLVNEHLILNAPSAKDFQRQLIDHYSYIAPAERTHRKYASVTTNPPESKPLPFDVKVLKGM